MDNPTPTGLPRVVHVSDKVPGAVYVGRKHPRQHLSESPLANPFPLTKFSRAASLALYVNWITSSLKRRQAHQAKALVALRTAPAIACWCRHDGQPPSDQNACHADVLLAILARYSDEQILSGTFAE